MSSSGDLTPVDLLRVAVVHEWVDSYAGSEQVFETIAKLIPHADLYALSVQPNVRLDLGGRSVTTTFLDSGGLRSRRDLTLPIMPLAWTSLGRRNYDLVITSHHAFAHGNRLAAKSGTHLSYVHTPARYIWSPEIDERGRGVALAPARGILKRFDRRLAGRVDAYAGNSRAVADRIQKYWGRKADVIHPPVRVDYFADHGVVEPTRDYVLGVGRWIPYKNLDLVIEAADKVGLPVKIAGRGPSKARITEAAAAASVPVELIESPSDAELRRLYANAGCLVFPTVEDFGMVPVEAQAAGAPIVAIPEGGVLETVVEGVSGVYAAELSSAAIAEAIPRALPLHGDGPSENAMSFSQQAFSRAFSDWVENRARITLRNPDGQPR